MFTLIGKYMSNLFGQVGGAAQMVRSSLFWLTHSRFEFGQAVEQSVTIGVESLGVTALTSLFTGMVLALQAGNTIGNIFGEPIFVGTIVTFSLIRELGAYGYRFVAHFYGARMGNIHHHHIHRDIA